MFRHAADFLHALAREIHGVRRIARDFFGAVILFEKSVRLFAQLVQPAFDYVVDPLHGIHDAVFIRPDDPLGHRAAGYIRRGEYFLRLFEADVEFFHQPRQNRPDAAIETFFVHDSAAVNHKHRRNGIAYVKNRRVTLSGFRGKKIRCLRQRLRQIFDLRETGCGKQLLRKRVKLLV